LFVEDERAGALDGALQPVLWRNGRVELLDQTRLPSAQETVVCDTVQDVAHAIRSMVVRGAPAIGVTAAYGYALAAVTAGPGSEASELSGAYDLLLSTRPTAVNLRWALDRMRAVAEASRYADVADRLLAEAAAIHGESYEADRRLSELGAEALGGRTRILTHCNAGPLATAGYGTAIGVIRRLAELDSRVSVFADETRPFLQGARLTAWELSVLGIPVTIITDGMAGHLMQQGEIDAVVVGADRIAANGDVANKIGTYSLAVLAREHDIPFYVAAPTSTIDPRCRAGSEIPIEERDPSEITMFAGVQVAPAGAQARHPAFDVTPARFIAGIITENGVARRPWEESIAGLVSEAVSVA